MWSAKYEAFGKAEVDPAPTIQNNLRFPGQYYDSETGLHYNYHRYYDPKTGRYLTPDPIGLAGGINLFPYVNNNATNYGDAIGLLPPQRCTIPCCNDCNFEERVLFRPTGKAWVEFDWDWSKRIKVGFTYGLVKTARVGVNFVPGKIGELLSKVYIPEIPVEHVIGQMLFFVEYAEFDCWIETCKDVLTHPKEHCYRKGTGTERAVLFNESQLEIVVNY